MKEQENKLREAIMADARSTAEGIIAAARKEAEDITAASRDTVRKLREALLAQARQSADRKTRMMASGTDMAIARQWLAAQEDCIGAVLDQALAQAEAVNGEQQEASLAALAKEAIAAIGDESCVVRAGDAAASLVTADWLARQARDLFGNDAKASYSVERDSALSGGLVFVTTDGRKTFDNTYARRLERMRGLLRLMIVNG